jgi:hypothetical protein
LFDVKGTAGHLCRGIGVEPALEPASRPYLVPGRAAAIRPAGRPPDAGTAPLGVLGVLQPKLAAALGVGERAEAAAERVAQLEARAGVARLGELGVEEPVLPEVVATVVERPELRNTPDSPSERELLKLLKAAL